MKLRYYGAVAATLILAYVSPATAQSLRTGQCLPGAQVREALKAEGQNTIIVGNRTGYGYATALVFTSNADGSRGYLLRGDKPLGQQADTICIDSVYEDVRLNDITQPGIPAWAQLGGNAARAEAICKRDRLGYQEMCQPQQASVEALHRDGQQVLFMATGTAINPRDKTIRTGQRVWLTQNGSGGGALSATTPEGASYVLSAYTSGALSQHGAAMLNR
jgi:hypothetical protein